MSVEAGKIARATATKYKQALRYLDEVKQLNAEILQEANRIAGSPFSSSEMRRNIDQSAFMLPIGGEPGGLEALRDMFRSTLVEGIRTFDALADELGGQDARGSMLREEAAAVVGHDGDREQLDTEPEKVRKLREFTGAGFRDTIRVLRDCGGDIDAAAEALKARGLADIAWMAERDWGEVKLLPPKCTLQSIPDTIPGDAGPKGGTGTNSASGVCKSFQAGRCVVHGRDTGPCDWDPMNWRICNVVIQNTKYGGW